MSCKETIKTSLYNALEWFVDPPNAGNGDGAPLPTLQAPPVKSWTKQTHNQS